MLRKTAPASIRNVRYPPIPIPDRHHRQQRIDRLVIQPRRFVDDCGLAKLGEMKAWTFP